MLDPVSAPPGFVDESAIPPPPPGFVDESAAPHVKGQINDTNYNRAMASATADIGRRYGSVIAPVTATLGGLLGSVVPGGGTALGMAAGTAAGTGIGKSAETIINELSDPKFAQSRAGFKGAGKTALGIAIPSAIAGLTDWGFTKAIGGIPKLMTLYRERAAADEASKALGLPQRVFGYGKKTISEAIEKLLPKVTT